MDPSSEIIVTCLCVSNELTFKEESFYLFNHYIAFYEPPVTESNNFINTLSSNIITLHYFELRQIIHEDHSRVFLVQCFFFLVPGRYLSTRGNLAFLLAYVQTTIIKTLDICPCCLLQPRFGDLSTISSIEIRLIKCPHC